MTSPSKTASDTVRVAVTHIVAPKNQKAFEKTLKGVMTTAQSYRGFLGTEIVHRKVGEYLQYNVFYQFDNLENYSEWNESKKKLGLVDELHQHTVHSHKTTLSGLETWFSLSTEKPIIPPPKYKMALTSWACVYALLILIFTFFARPLIELPLMLRFLIVSLIIITLMTYVIMPLMTRLLARWLYPDRK